MFAQIGQLLVDVAASFFVYLLLARFLLQWRRISFHNPLGAFIIATTDWLVRPLRRGVPSLAGLDLASLVGAWLLQAAALWALFALGGWRFGGAPGVAAAVIAVVALIDLARFALYLLSFAVIVQAILSWVNPYAPIGPLFDALTRPFLGPIRRWLPPIAQVDLSPLVLLVVLQVLLIPLAQLRALVGGVF
jgi:YggT family protein